MSRRRLLRLFALVSLLVPAFASRPAARPQSAQTEAPAAGQERAQITIKETIDPEKRLAQIKEDIEALKKKIAAEDKKEKTMLSSLDRIGFAKSLIRKEQAALAIDLDKNRRELAAVGRDIPALEANLDREKEDLAKVLVALFKYGRFPTARFLMMAADLRTFVSQGKNLEILASYQDRMIADYVRGLAELGRGEEALAPEGCPGHRGVAPARARFPAGLADARRAGWTRAARQG